jgi:translation elongation factor EF-4
MSAARAMVTYDLPLNEVVFDFYDRLKSISKGYASFDYQISDYRAGDLVRCRSSSMKSRSTRCRCSCTARRRSGAAAPCARSSRT